MKLALILSTLTLLQCVYCQFPRCGPNAVLTNCYNECRKTCRTRLRGNLICDAACTRIGCVCVDGYLEHNNGTCVPVSQCSPPDCNSDETYKSCGTACPASCANKEPTICTLQCKEDCFCNNGTIRLRNDNIGPCVAPQYCSEPPKCGPNEVFTNCYNDCQLTCRNRIKGYVNYCTNECKQKGCICQAQYYRHDNGSCVPEDDCSPPHCNDDEEFNACGTSCLDTCEERGNTCQDCSLHCVEGCFCPEGYFRQPNGSCVKAEDCPPRTCDGPNEYFDECPPTCLDALDESCSTIWSGVNCTETLDCCQPQCRCKTGYYRDTEGFCITADACKYDGVDSDSPWWISSSTQKPIVLNVQENSIPNSSEKHD